MNDPISIKDIAAHCGVSAMTVSRALRGVNGVGEETRARVLKTAEDMNYVPNSNARSLVKSSANIIGISFPTLFNDVFADMFEGMRRTFDNAGYSTVVNTTNYDVGGEADWVSNLLSWRPAGIVLTGVDHDPSLRRIVRSVEIPTVEIWDVTDDPIDMCVGIDHFLAGFDLAQLMIEKGYRRPAYLGLPIGRDQRSDRRFYGIQKAFEQLDASCKVAHSIHEFSNQFKLGFEGTRELLREPTKPDIIFYSNDHMAFGGISAAETFGFDVPDDIGIVGFNALSLTEVLRRKLTTVRTPRRLMGETAARNMIAKINGVTPDTTVRLPVKIEAGETTRSR